MLWLLMGLLRGMRRLRLLCRFRLLSLIALVVVLGGGNGRGCEEQRQDCRADYTGLFHVWGVSC